MTCVSGLRCFWLLPAVLLAMGAAAACSKPVQAPHGAPALIKVYWIAGGTSYLVWSPSGAPDPAQVADAPALASEIDFVFNRRLDGNRIEDTVIQDGVSVERSKATPPITVTGFDPQSTSPPFRLDVLYNSAGIFGNDTSYVLARPQVPGFPSAAAVTFQLDRSNLTSPYDEPLPEPDSVPITTRAFTVDVGTPAATDAGTPAVATTFQLPLSFSNRPATPARVLAFVHVSLRAGAGALALPIDLLADARDPALLRVVPAACLVTWPPDSTIDVTIDPGLPDAFGVALATGATATFTTGAGPPPGAACPTSGDAGVD